MESEGTLLQGKESEDTFNDLNEMLHDNKANKVETTNKLRRNVL